MQPIIAHTRTHTYTRTHTKTLCISHLTENPSQMKALSDLKIIQRIPGNLKFTEKISVEKENIWDQQKYLIMQKEKGL